MIHTDNIVDISYRHQMADSIYIDGSAGEEPRRLLPPRKLPAPTFSPEPWFSLLEAELFSVEPAELTLCPGSGAGKRGSGQEVSM